MKSYTETFSHLPLNKDKPKHSSKKSLSLGGGGPHRGGGPIRGGGPNRFGDSRQANIPYNRDGHIKSYTKDDGQKAHAKGGTDTATFLNPSNRFKPRSSVPTMDQIQSGKD